MIGQMTNVRVHIAQLGSTMVPGEMVAPVFHEPVREVQNIAVVHDDDDDQTTLIDAGPGPFSKLLPDFECIPLEEVLGGIGVDPRSVRRIVITHLDFDHVGGTVKGDWPTTARLAFPDARVLLSTDEASSYRAKKGNEPFNVGTPILRILDQADVVDEVRPDVDIGKGIRLRAAPGHTPGHTIVELPDGSVYISDLIHHECHAQHPSWAEAHDQDRATALKTRKAILSELADRHVQVVAAHISGRGRISRRGDSYCWEKVVDDLPPQP